MKVTSHVAQNTSGRGSAIAKRRDTVAMPLANARGRHLGGVRLVKTVRRAGLVRLPKVIAEGG